MSARALPYNLRHHRTKPQESDRASRCLSLATHCTGLKMICCFLTAIFTLHLTVLPEASARESTSSTQDAAKGPQARPKDFPIGISREKPAKGRSVKTRQGFMVPYKTRIPGTNISFEMVPIPGGTFKIGSPKTEAGRREDEGPQQAIRVRPFWMGRHEITWAEYKVFMGTYEIFKQRETERRLTVTKRNRVDAITAPTPLYEPTETYYNGEDPTDPAVTMTQYAARQYTKWLSLMSKSFYRLPTEAEWEYAARAGTKTAYFFGNDPARIGEYAWYAENSDETYQHVGKKKANPWGLHDIYGNVAELVIDEYEADAYRKLKGNGLTATSSIVWPRKIFPQVVRGGAWDSEPAYLRSASRTRTYDWRENDPNLPLSPWWFADEDARSVGFRIARPLDVPPRKDQEKFWELYSKQLHSDVANRLRGGRGVEGWVDSTLPKEIKAAGGGE